MSVKRIDGWPALMSREVAALYLDCSPRTVDDLQSQRKLTPVKSDFGKRFARSELDRYIGSLDEWAVGAK